MAPACAALFSYSVGVLLLNALSTKTVLWSLWTTAVIGLSVWLSWPLIFEEQQDIFLAGAATHGHHQIELACNACHTSPFGGKEVLQSACIACHGAELKAVSDSHPTKKFTDPRNADIIERLDARYCIACHAEHQLERTRPMGVTLPEDFCFECHEDVGRERPSHAGMGFETCASAGCHNFHDNLALYEDFLLKHSSDPWLLETQRMLEQPPQRGDLAARVEPDAPNSVVTDKAVTADWQHSAHAAAGVNCSDCHGSEQQWQPKPLQSVCAGCHEQQFAGFTAGKHGMRLAQGLSPMVVDQARIAMKPEAGHRELTCNSCHSAHAYDRQVAAVDSCQSCHDSEHSRNYAQSPHAGLEAPVTCATCHMPRQESPGGGFHVQHNQSDNLRPNEKMIRSVCLDCHGLGFAIDALADEALINRNFTGRPALHIESIDMAVDRANAAPTLDNSYQ